MSNSTRPAAIYARISNDKQDGAGVSRQIETCQERATAMGLETSPAHTYVDNDISAWSGKVRPAFEQLQAAMVAGEVSAVLAWAPDRISRQVVEYETFKVLAMKAGVRLVYISGGELDLEDPNSGLFSTIMAASAKWESDIKSKRISAARKQAAMAGRPPGGPRRFGYSPDGMELVPAEAGALREVISAILAGASIGSQARLLNERGLLTPARISPKTGADRGSNEWSTRTLKLALLSPTLAGIPIYRGEPVEGVAGSWPAIISPAEHYQLVAILQARRGTNPAAGKGARHLLTGIALCGGDKCENGTMMAAQSKRRGATVKVYSCRFGHGGGGPKGASHVTRTIELMDAVVRAAVLARLDGGQVSQRMAETGGENTAPLLAERSRIQASLAEVADSVVRGTFTVSQAETMTTGLRQRLDAVEARLAAVDPASAMALVSGVEDYTQWWDVSSTLDQRRALVSALMDVVVLPVGRGGPPAGPETIKITWKV